MLNPGRILPVGLVWGRGEERPWPGEQRAQSGLRPGQVVVVELQRPFLPAFQLLFLLTLLLLSPQVDLREAGGRSGTEHSSQQATQQQLVHLRALQHQQLQQIFFDTTWLRRWRWGSPLEGLQDGHPGLGEEETQSV